MIPHVRRLNVGCGPFARPEWINADFVAAKGVDVVVDIRSGLPFVSERLDYVVASHVLQDLPYHEVSPALAELKRVLVPGGWLRVSLPDLDKAIQAYAGGNHAYFHVPDTDAKEIGTKLVTQLVWYGSVRTPFTFDCIAEFLARHHFRRIYRCAFRQTRSPYPDIVGLDNRPRESLFVEAMK
jgi:SAM-dependent methyltransferase